MPYFKQRAEIAGDEKFAAMLREIQERPDLRALV